jgi:hypothetical protein
MSTHAEVVELLDEQCRAYREMYEVGRMQRACIEGEDDSGLEDAFARMHKLMDEVRLRQEHLPRSSGGESDIEQRFAQMRDLLKRLQAQRQVTQHTTEQMLKRNRDEFRQFGRARRAARGYQNARAPEANLYDGRR